MKRFKNGFTIIELVFVIVVLGILASVAIPKLSGVVEDANFASAKATISSLRTAINTERQRTLLQGNTAYPEILDDASTGTHEELFDGNSTVHILQYPVYSKTTTGGWMKTSDNSGASIEYKYYINDSRTVDFNYTKSTGTFDCDHSIEDCRFLIE